MGNEDLGIYIHIPFCQSKCLYCDFPSYAGQEEKMEAYFRALLREIDIQSNYISKKKIRSIYIGGGTPTYFRTSYIGKILDRCYSQFTISGEEEITIEANPGTLDREKLIALKGFGINRLSVGLQAWQLKHLKALGRTHDSNRVKSEIESAREVGFENISVDLMFGLPSQTIYDWVETLEKVCSLETDHISAYSLIIEEETPLYEMVRRGEHSPIDESLERHMYREGVSILEGNGFEQYEISNFAKRGYRSIHNLIYWENGNYIGFGCGAHSNTDNIRRYNYRGIDDYILAMDSCRNPVEHRECIDLDIERFETIMMGLRLIDGIDKNRFLHRFGKPIDFYYRDTISKLKGDGLLGEDEKSIYVTSRGMDIHNTVILEFLDYVDK